MQYLLNALLIFSEIFTFSFRAFTLYPYIFHYFTLHVIIRNWFIVYQQLLSNLAIGKMQHLFISE